MRYTTRHFTLLLFYFTFVCAGEGQVFTVGKIGKHRVVSTKLPRIGQESATYTATRSIVTRLLGQKQR